MLEVYHNVTVLLRLVYLKHFLIFLQHFNVFSFKNLTNKLNAKEFSANHTATNLVTHVADDLFFMFLLSVIRYWVCLKMPSVL